MPHKTRSLRFTKEMDALPLRHPRSPIFYCVSERGWLLYVLHAACRKVVPRGSTRSGA